MGLDVKDVRFPTWGAALSCILQFDYPREGFVNDALMLAMGAPWLNTKMVVAVSPDTDTRRSRAMSISRWRRAVDPARDIIIVAQYPRLAVRPVRRAARRAGPASPGRQDRHRCHRQVAPRHQGFRTGLAGQLGQGPTRRLSVNGGPAMDDDQRRRPRVLVRSRALHSLCEGGRLRCRTQARGRALQEAHGLSAERAEALCLSAGNRRDAVEAQQQCHARSVARSSISS